ncbi:MAG: hypothetical protein QM758_25865 [Armatimonas sp.]
MRNRTGSKWNRYSMWLALSVGALGLVLGLTAGCGGGGSDDQPTPTPTPTPTVGPATTTFRATILWRARTRIEATGLASALSARITLYGANIGGSDNTFTINRDLARTAAYTETYTSPVAAIPGTNYRFRIQFFSQPNGQGTEVGFADTSATLAANGDLTGTIATYNIGIQRVVVTPGQSIAYGENKTVDFKVIDREGHEVTLAEPGASSGITYGGAQVAVVSGFENNLKVEPNGSITALKPSSAQVTVQVEDKISPAETITITSPTTITVSPNAPGTVGWQNTLGFTAALPGLPSGLSGSNLGVTWVIEDDDSTKGTITPTGTLTATYTAPKADKNLVIKVSSNFDPAKFVEIPVTVRSLTSVAVTADGGNPVLGEPGPNKVSINQVVDFDAVVSNGNLSPVDQAVTWRLLDGSKQPVTGPQFGAVTTAGVYTAPAVRPTADGKCFIRVTPAYDPTKFRDIPIEIVSGSIGVDIN